MRRIAALGPLVFLGTSCVTLSPEQKAYVDTVMRQPTTFRVSKAQAEETWGRGQSFIGQHSSMKIQVATDYVLQTYNPSDQSYGIDYGYYLTRTPAGEDVGFNVRCLTNNMFAGGDANRNAHILAHYMVTGELPYPGLIQR